MTEIHPSLAEKRYPVRYWMMLIYAAGLPNFVKFDETGLTHKTGQLNASSMIGILEVFIIGFLMVGMWVLNRQPLVMRSFAWCKWVWAVLFANLTLSTLLMEPNRLIPSAHRNDILISLFRLDCGALALLLLVSIYSREPEERAMNMIVRMIGFCCWFNIIVIWIALPLFPGLAYNADPDAPEAARRLGGAMISPIGLGSYAGIAFFYAFLFWRGRTRFVACCVALLTLALTYARAPQMSFLLLFMFYLLYISRRPIYRWGAALLLILGISGAVVFSNQILSYEARGNGVNNILTLSERTYVWEACLKAFALRPWIGYGVAKGVQNAIRDQWTFTHWIPPEAHNELLQALVSGGVLCCALVLYLFVQTIWKGFRIFRYGKKEVFLFLVLLQVTIVSIGESILTVGFGRSSAMFAMAFLGINGSYQRYRNLAKERTRRSQAAIEASRMASV